MNFNNLHLAKKLGIGFGVVLTIVAASSVIVFVEAQKVGEIERLNSDSDNAVDFIDQAWGDLNNVRASLYKLTETNAATDKAGITSALDEMTKDLKSAKDILAKDGPELLPYLDTYQSAIDAYVQNVVTAETALASDPSKHSQAVTMLSSDAATALAAATEQAFTPLRDKANTWSDSWTEAGNRAMMQIALITALGGLLSIVVGIAMAWLIVRVVARPMAAMTDAMRRLATGDTSVVIPAVGQTDEIGQMAGAVQVFKDAGLEKHRLEIKAGETQRQAADERVRNEADRAAITRQQEHVVESIGQGLENLSNGALTFRIGQAFAADYDKLRVDFNGAMEKLQDTMVVVAANTSAIRSGTGEITSAADDLSRRTEQQAASLEETAAALDEITATVRKTAEGSKHARDVVGAAKTDAERSGQIVRQAIEAMAAIEKSSDQIGQIIGVIDEIAFQTNLLALNAGVEAARAGDAGRGFAVVASEVRALAQRSADAAKEIKALISASSGHVEQGVDLVGQTGKALERIVSQVAEINGIVGEIAASAQEQATGLDQVNTAVNQMDQVTQQNAAMVEESTAAGHALAQETEELSRVISGFEVGHDTTRSGSRPVARPAPAAKPRPQAKPVAALKSVGAGGAVRKPAPAADAESWQEF